MMNMSFSNKKKNRYILFGEKNQQYTYSLCAQLTYASSNSRTEQAYSLLMNKFIFTGSKKSLKLALSASIC